MGGSGSGRRQRYQRRTTEGYLALDIAVLRRRGLLQPGHSSVISWSRGGERIGSATVRRGCRKPSSVLQTTGRKVQPRAVDESIEIPVDRDIARWTTTMVQMSRMPSPMPHPVWRASLPLPAVPWAPVRESSSKVRPAR